MTPKAADATFKIRFLREVKSDADTKFKLYQWGTQERKFNFVKKSFAWYYQWKYT